MRLASALCGLIVAVAVVNAGPIYKRETEDISPLNEVYAFQNEADVVADDERTDRDKRKIGIVKLGVTNGILNFVFGKIDALLDAKTKALGALDEGNKAKNLAFGIDNTQSATGQFIGNLISQKLQAGTASIGPLISGATTFFSSASSGLSNAFAAKLAPLSSLSGGLSGGNGGDGGSGGGFGSLLSSGIETISSLSGSSSSGGNSGSSDLGGGANAGAGLSLGGGAGGSSGGGLNLGAFANLGGAPSTVSTTTEDIPEFDRTHVSLDVPPPVFGGGFNLITDVSRVLSSVILNSARRTQSLLEVTKPLFRGAFAIKGLPSDNPK